MTRERTIVVIGAGFAGLAAAVRLADEGCRVVVIEATKGGGGRSRSFTHDGGTELDNGQHLLMGCYRETLAFLRAIGKDDAIWFQRNLAVHMVKEGGGRIRLECPALPAPLHLAAGLLTMRGVGLLHKAAALRAGLLLRNEIVRPDDHETCDAWLRRMGQTQVVRAAFWDPLIWSVLNDDPLIASAAMLVAVLERAFMGTRDGSRLGVPKQPLRGFYLDAAIAHLQAKGATLHMGAAVRALEVHDDRITGVTLKSGEVIACDTAICAVPPHALLELLPPAALRHPVFQDVARLTYSPIINLWLFLDRPLFSDVPFLGLVGSPLHWLFDKNQLECRTGAPVLVDCTISGARSLIQDDPQIIVDLFRAEARKFFPGQPFEILDHKVVKEKRATISHAAGTYSYRPSVKSPIRGLLLAGDWVRTGLPATIESACQSGHDAADLILERARVLL